MGENRGTGWPVILAHTPVIYMFTPKPPTPSKSVPHLFFLHTHFCACVCASRPLFAICVCARARLRVWRGQLILSARKSPAARIWSWESVLCSVDMWHGAKMGSQPLSISRVQRCPITASASPESGGECWEKLHIAKNKFAMLKTPHFHSQKPVRIPLNVKKILISCTDAPQACDRSIFCLLLKKNELELVEN